ncbi:unnamed protein product, partial [Phaeothamnion confervicola]
MYIEEIVIDGFKSYATRTVLSGFDPHFNAITGLNGSGKSNILDSICFVLGISNLSQVRAGNLQELVYKQGQAGVTRAEVTLVFNNEDKRSSPIGKEHLNKFSVSRTVVAGGKNKYAIDGRTAQQSQVQNLFHSVQLNVNNPHFLIMQGRITKVLNMKPPEILGMIEEAAGTRMFENKRQSSLRTIEKKQAKVHEINSFLEGEINPRLEKLREEKRKHDAWESTGEELKRRERRLVAFEFSEVDRLVHESKDEALRFDERQAALAAKAAQLKAALKAKDAEMAALEGKRDGAAGKALKMAVATAEGLSKELVQA